MSIACATDLSHRSLPALNAACALARQLREPELWLVHVLDASVGSLSGEALTRLVRIAPCFGVSWRANAVCSYARGPVPPCIN